MYEPALTVPDTAFFQQMRASWSDAQEVERIIIPLVMPSMNRAQNWYPMARAYNVRMIHEAVRISCEHMFDREPWPEKWEWGSGKCPLKSDWITSKWFIDKWHKSVLGNATINPPGTGTVVELIRLKDGRTHVHVHSLLNRLRDEDQTYTKHLLDGLTHVGFFPDDRTKYVAGLTKTQSLVKGKRKKIPKKRKKEECRAFE